MSTQTRGSFASKSLIIILILVLAVTGGLYWWRKVYTQPSNVFNRMIDNAFSSNSISKSSFSGGDGQNIAQTTDVFLSPDPVIHSQVKISQTGEQSSSVVRETVTTTSESFIRLASIETTQKNSSGKTFDFSSIIGVWGRSPADETNNSSTQLFGQNVAVPFANLAYTSRKNLVSQIERDGVYEVDYQNVKRSRQNGRLVYEFTVNVKPEAFINMMKTLGGLVGVAEYEQVNASEYKNLPKVKFSFFVDVLSGDLIKVDYGNDQIENYSGFGIRTLPGNPKNSVTMLELQQRLQKLQQ